MKDFLRLIVSNEFGLSYSKEFKLDTCLSAVVDESIHQLYVPSVSIDDINIVCVRRGQRLNKCYSLAQAEVQSMDQILVVSRCDDDHCPIPLLTGGISETDADAELEMGTCGGCGNNPDHDDIASATTALEKRNFDRSPSMSGNIPLMQAGGSALSSGMVPVLVSLIEEAQRVLCLHRSAARILALVKAGASSSLSNYPPAQPALVKQLVEMGFQEQQAERALALTFNTVSDAMDWILNHGDAEASTEPEHPVEDTEPSGEQDENFVEPLPVSQTLELFRKYSRAQFQPNHHLKLKFLEMGFDDVSVMDALRISSNDESQTLEILLNRNSAYRLPETSREELPILDRNSKLYKALILNPTVQLSLTNPTTLFGFLSVLDNPQSLSQWQTQSPDFGSLMRLISSLYFENVEEHQNSDAAAGAEDSVDSGSATVAE